MELINREQCTGCMACFQVCPMKCISIEEDDLGHKYPAINHLKCIECGKCNYVCPESNTLVSNTSKKAYAAWSLDSKDRLSSASGGAASVFYQTAIEQEMYISGAIYDNNFEVKHIVSNNIEDISKFKQSKYVYSNSDDIYNKIKILLDDGKQVLFISLPCKIAGLLSYLGKNYPRLITIDIVCHGTPSYKMLKEHIFNKSSLTNLDNLSFRNNNVFMFQLTGNNKKIYRKINILDEYLAAFLKSVNYRESCYQCKYAKNERISDITICDFWGLGKNIPFDHPYTGSISAVLINTENGKLFFDKNKTKLFFEERQVKEAIEGNSQLNHPTIKPLCFNEFNNLYRKYGLDKSSKILFRKERLTYKVDYYYKSFVLNLKNLIKLIFKIRRK